MKGNERILQTLNDRLAEELTAINQYMVHSESCENWGYLRLHKRIRAQGMDEMRHAEWLIERILFLEGIPSVSRLNAMTIGKSVQEMIDNDRDDERDADLVEASAMRDAYFREGDDSGRNRGELIEAASTCPAHQTSPGRCPSKAVAEGTPPTSHSRR